MNLKPTQKAVLKVLYENKDKWVGSYELNKLCKKYGVASNHVENAVKFFMRNDLVYPPTIEGEIKISPCGIEVYLNN